MCLKKIKKNADKCCRVALSSLSLKVKHPFLFQNNTIDMKQLILQAKHFCFTTPVCKEDWLFKVTKKKVKYTLSMNFSAKNFK